jgi:AraC-like DNA-binding protein
MSMTTESKRSFQAAFFKRAGPNAATFRKILDFFPDAGLYIIDEHDRIVAFNHRNCEVNNIVSELDYIGRTCSDIYPKEFAEQYMALVRQVRETGEAVENQIYTHASDHSTDFRVASVYPFRDARGKIIGTASVWRPVASGDSLPDWYGCLKKVVAFIDRNYAQPLTLQMLAVEAGMSLTHFRRRFADILHITPARYLATIRINAAIRLMTSTNKLLSEIAQECGFYDQSHFIRTFKRIRRQTPAQYRRAHFSA